jgi:oxygen-independent coproporphyrinogen-3 oxidase
VEFAVYFREEMARLNPLVDDGLVTVSATRIQATSRGRLRLRIIAACFDRYLHQASAEPARFSRSI